MLPSKKTAHAAEQDRPDVAARRQAWFDAQPDLDPQHLVFIDETGASTKMARRYGRSRRGQRCRAPIPPPDPAAHKSASVRTLIEAAGAHLLYLPPYSPDFNPIENAFSKLKSILRKAAARTIPTLWTAIGEAMAAYTPDECANYFTATGYEPE